MSARDITLPVERQDEQADDGLDIPEFLKISPERRKQAWREFDALRPPKPAPALGRERTPTEIAYYASIEAEKAAHRAWMSGTTFNFLSTVIDQFGRPVEPIEITLNSRNRVDNPAN